MSHPEIQNAPGLKWRPIKAGWQAKWRARGDLVKRGYAFRSLVLWYSTKENPEPSEIAKLFIAQRCQSLQDDMLVWARGGVPELGAYDKTWQSLTRCYKTDPDSPYHSKEYATRHHYDALCRRIDEELGNTRIADTDARALLRLHERIIKPDKEGDEPKISMGHAVIGMMRTVTTFGATLLKCPDCRLIRSDLRDMRVKNGTPREEALTADQAIAIRKEAHRMVRPYRHSLALAQALQFDVGSGMRQKDIIGAWVPLSERGVSDIFSGDMKWVKGIRAEEIDENLILRHVTSKRKKLLVADLKLSPMVMEEFRMMAGLESTQELLRGHIPTSGPLIINEQTGEPWEAGNFRKAWREIARKCGVPDTVRNMDSRSGAITEAFAAGADPDDIRKGATHSNLSMTTRYSRGDAVATAKVAQFRTAHRSKAPK